MGHAVTPTLLRGLWALTTALVLAGAVATTVVDLTDSADLLFGLGFVLLGVGAATAGSVVYARVPGNAVGPILLSMGLGLGVLLTSGAYVELSLSTGMGPLPGAAWASWIGAWLSVPTFFGLTAFLLLLFPDGRLVSPRWRWVAWSTAAGVSVATVSSMFTPRRLSPGYDNPVGASGTAAELVRALEDVTDWLALPILVAAAVALSIRLRLSRGIERQQLKWFTYVAAVAGAGLGLTVLTRGLVADFFFLWALLGLASLPIVAGVAILRHGLYEIDVVIKRTLVYATLTAALVTTYLVLVLVLQLGLRPLTGDSNLAVAGSTLAVAALFRPLRDRIRAVVDRRFYRQRYDATKALEAFVARLRDELDPDAIAVDMRHLVDHTLHPTSMSLWLRSTR